MRAAIYARYSSDSQREASLEDQERRCRQEADRAGYQVVDVWTDAALSGALAENQRPGLQTMMAAAKARAFDVLLVDDASRLSRDASDALRLLQRLDFWGLGFVAISDGINTTTNGKTSRLLFGIKSAINEDFRRDLGEKTRRGLEGRARAGLSAGGLPYGYRSTPIMDARGAIVGYQRLVHAGEAAIVRRIFEEYAAGRSTREIVARMNVEGITPPAARWKNKTPRQAASWSVSTLMGGRRLGKGVLYNPLYRGQVVWNRSQWQRDPDTGRETYRVRPKDDWIISDAPALRIVSDDLWERVQTRSQRRSPGAAGLHGRFRHYLLSGFVTCGVCGGAYVVKTPYSYRCAAHHTRGAAVCPNDRPVSRKPLERTVLKALREVLFTPANIDALTSAVRTRLLQRQRAEADQDAREERRRALDRLDTEIAHIEQALLLGKATAHLLTMLEDRTKQREALRAAEPSSTLTDALDAVLARLPSVVNATLDELVRSWEAGDVADGKRVLAALGTQIRLHPSGQRLEAHISGDVERILRLAAPRGAASTFNSTAFSWLGEEDSNPR